MSIINPVCRVCGIVLNDSNWFPSGARKYNYICRICNNKQAHASHLAHPENSKPAWTRHNRKRGMRPFDENRDCSSFLGVHVAERVLSMVFKDVKRMPMNNPGHDVVCNHGMKIDIKSACLGKRGHWIFVINHNTVADYFLCLAFDNRKNLNPEHIWLIPGRVVCHLQGASIRRGTLSKWDEYKLDISKVISCCDTIKSL